MIECAHRLGVPKRLRVTHSSRLMKCVAGQADGYLHEDIDNARTFLCEEMWKSHGQLSITSLLCLLVPSFSASCQGAGDKSFVMSLRRGTGI
jgi:hypothetical protein